MSSTAVVWVGLELPGPGYPQKVQPNEVEVFATEHDARVWQFENKVTATSPLRELYKRRVRRGETPPRGQCGGSPAE